MSKTKVFVAGHLGMVGSSLVRSLSLKKNISVISANKSELDLTRQHEVEDFFSVVRPDVVFLAAAKVGGIRANSEFPADFIYQNLSIQTNVIHGSFMSGVKKLLFLGSTCIYPKFASQPIKEESLLSGYLEPTNEPYAIAKIAGLKMCLAYNKQYGRSHEIDYRCVMPTNLYGPGDNFDIDNGHVVPALMTKIHQAKISGLDVVEIWGSGNAKREFLFVDDLARACLTVMDASQKSYKYLASSCGHLNIGYGSDVTIFELAYAIKKAVGYEGSLVFNSSLPEGTPRKLADSSRVKTLGWEPLVTLDEGLNLTYDYYLSHQA